MKYASLVKLGGELIAASDATYEDYKGFLQCPNCGELVFLRKAHTRKGKRIESAFIHHEAIPGISICEARVGNFSSEVVQKTNSIARGQRISKLNISMWKYLKSNLAVNLLVWNKFKKDIERFILGKEVVKFAYQILQDNVDFICKDTFQRIEKLLYEHSSQIVIADNMKKFIDSFINSKQAKWKLHCKIALEALELFLESKYLEGIRYRVLYCLCHPQALSFMPGLLDLDTSTNEWREQFASFLTLEITFIFLSVDWIEIFEID